MEIYDILMLVVLVGAALFGAIKGFAWQLASIASIVVSYVVAYQFREPFSQSIQADPPWNRFLAMLILYVGTSLVIWVAFRMISGTIDRLKLREFDRHVGAVFGLAKGALFCTLITLFAVTLLGDNLRSKIVASKSGRYIAKVLDQSESVIPPEIHEVVRPYLQRFDDRFNETESESGGVLPWIAEQVTGGGSPENPFDGRLPKSYWDASTGQQNGLANQPPSTIPPSSYPAARPPTYYGQQNVLPPTGNQPGSGYVQPSYGQPSYGQPTYRNPNASNNYGSQPGYTQPAYGQPSSYRSP